MNQLYILLFQKNFFRIDNEPELFTVLILDFWKLFIMKFMKLQVILELKMLELEIFQKKRGNEYYTLFDDLSKNVVIENIDENDESKVKIIL